MSTPRATIIARFGLLGLVIVVQFWAFEMVLRLRGAGEAASSFRQLYLQDERLGYRMAPGVTVDVADAEFQSTVTTNALGLRDEALGPKRAGERRVVVLGDSIVMAVQVPLEQTFVKRLERRLNAVQTADGPFRVINAGIQGYGPVQECLLFEGLADQLAADTVIVGLYVVNDAQDAESAGHRLATATSASGGRAPVDVATVVPDESPLRSIRRLLRKSIVLQVLRRHAINLATQLGQPRPLPMSLAAFTTEDAETVTRGLAIVRACIERIAATATRHGARTVVVLLPGRFQVDRQKFSELQQSASASGSRLDWDLATDRFRRALSGLSGVEVFDPLPALRRHPNPRGLYFDANAHLTPAGHDAMADALFDGVFVAGLAGDGGR